ncbi:hypothetical protein [Xanthomonas albilineans]|uniref:hypothetical protein n=1 Tax=Xanthomonas albilineans TaxID=29447 RepID=UPI0012D4984B|nr:hypothetical protein [Xanthomonas albilineans]
MPAIKMFRGALSMRSPDNILAPTVQGMHHHQWKSTMRDMTTEEIMEVSGGSPASQLNGFADLLIAGGTLSLGTGVLAGAGGFALGLGGSIKLGLVLTDSI